MNPENTNLIKTRKEAAVRLPFVLYDGHAVRLW